MGEEGTAMLVLVGWEVMDEVECRIRGKEWPCY